MKRKVVNLTDSEELTDIKRANGDMIYAADSKGDGHVIIVIKDVNEDGEETYKTTWLYADEMIDHIFNSDTLFGVLEQLIDFGYDVYEFECEEALAEWLSELYVNVEE